MRTNCWLWALPKWFRGERRYLIVRWSRRVPWIPHVMLTDDISEVEIEEAVPVNPKTGWRAWLDAPFFRARIRKGKGEETQ